MGLTARSEQRWTKADPRRIQYPLEESHRATLLAIPAILLAIPAILLAIAVAPAAMGMGMGTGMNSP